MKYHIVVLAAQLDSLCSYIKAANLNLVKDKIKLTLKKGIRECRDRQTYRYVSKNNILIKKEGWGEWFNCVAGEHYCHLSKGDYTDKVRSLISSNETKVNT